MVYPGCVPGRLCTSVVYPGVCTREATYLRWYTQGVYQVGYTSLYAPPPMCTRWVYLPICTPYHPGYTSVHTPCTVNIACTPVYVGVCSDDALGSRRRSSLGMRRIVPSLLLRCEGWYTSAQTMLCSSYEDRMKDWMLTGSSLLYYLGLGLCAQGGHLS